MSIGVERAGPKRDVVAQVVAGRDGTGSVVYIAEIKPPRSAPTPASPESVDVIEALVRDRQRTIRRNRRAAQTEQNKKADRSTRFSPRPWPSRTTPMQRQHA